MQGNADARSRRVCFGGVPEVAASGLYDPNALIVVGQDLYAAGSGIQRVDLRTGKVSSLAQIFHQGMNDIGPIDAREAYAMIGADIIAYDFRSQKTRTVVPGHLTVESPYPMNEPPFALDARYFYFGQQFGGLGTQPGTGMYRVRRDGSGQPELLGIPPAPGHYGGAILDGGFFYYRGGSRKTGLTIVRRRVEKGSPEQTLVVLKSPRNAMMRLFAGQLYFVDDQAIYSVPIAGGAQPKRLVAIGDSDPTDVLSEPGCLYWADGHKIRRVDLDRAGAAPEIIADDENYQEDLSRRQQHWRPGTLVSEGRFLYWPDISGERIMRARRDPRPPPARSELVAAWVSGTARSPVTVETVAVGDGWGCARFHEANVPLWQCWSAAPANAVPTAHVAAHDVPWLLGEYLAVGADRLCAPVRDGVKCWPWPEVGSRRPDDIPAKRADWGDARSTHVGGTFACANPDSVWRCAGDDHYGQLADGIKNVTPYGAQGTVGTWHGCTSAILGETFCWGRDDAFQLGFQPPDICQVGAERVPCSRSAHAVTLSVPQGSQLFAGDLFTCAASMQAPVCWGASRDGLFGEATACSSALRTAWPTRAGPVAAPRATCARTPSPVTAFPARPDWFSVGPRGMCGLVDGHPRCAGAIPTPAGDVASLAVSPGDQASACGVAGAKAVCWGAGYSPADNPAALVPVELDRPPLARVAVLDLPPRPGATWEASCKVNFGCDQPTRTLPICPRDTVAERWGDILAKAPSLVGKTVRARGPLALGWLARTQGFRSVPSHNFVAMHEQCGPGACCNHAPRPIVIGGAEEKLALPTFECAGDDSRVCCNAPAFGQVVIASGVLERTRQGTWQLASPEVCALSLD